MVNSCSVVGRANCVGKEKGLCFYHFLLGQQEMCEVNSCICNKHFFQVGSSSMLIDVSYYTVHTVALFS